MVVIDLNLLPWREKARRYQWQAWWKTGCAAFLVVVLILLIWHGCLWFLLQHVQAKTHDLEESLNQVTDNQSVTAVNNVKTRQHEQQALARLFAVLGSSLMTNTCFTDLTRRNQKMIFSGMAQTEMALNHFLMNWQAASLFSMVILQDFSYQPKDNVVHFHYQAQELPVHDV